MPQIIRVSVVQACTSAYSLPDTLDKLEYLANEARNNEAQLAVFPEAFIGGYPKMSTFGAVVGSRSEKGRDEFLRYHSSAIEIPSPALSRVELISARTGIFLVVGVIEKDQGTLYCSVVFVDPVSGYLGKHRKLVPTATERIIWGMGDATTLPVIARDFKNLAVPGPPTTPVNVKLSATVCWENYMPLLRTFYYSKGTQVYCAPTVDARPEWQHTMAHIALEGRCFVLSACQYSEEIDYPPDHPVADPTARKPENVVIAGGSVIISPLGKVLAGPLYGRAGILTTNIDLDDVVRGKFDLDVVGHYARPDIFQLNVIGTS